MEVLPIEEVQLHAKVKQATKVLVPGPPGPSGYSTWNRRDHFGHDGGSNIKKTTYRPIVAGIGSMRKSKIKNNLRRRSKKFARFTWRRKKTNVTEFIRFQRTKKQAFRH